MSSYCFFLYNGERAEEDTRMDFVVEKKNVNDAFCCSIYSIHWPNLWRAKLDFYDYYTFCFPLFHRMSCMLWPTPLEKRVGSPSLRAGVTTKDFWPHRNILWRWVLGQHYLYPKIQAIYISCIEQRLLCSLLYGKSFLLRGNFYGELFTAWLIFNWSSLTQKFPWWTFFKGTL